MNFFPFYCSTASFTCFTKRARYNSENTRNIGKRPKNAPFFSYARFVLLLFIKNCTTLDWIVCTIKIDQFDLEFLMRPTTQKYIKCTLDIKPCNAFRKDKYSDTNLNNPFKICC